MLKAVIFDLDGVVANSHPIHEAAWKTLLVEQGMEAASLNLDFLYAGHPRRAILEHYLGSIDELAMDQLGRRKDELYAIAASGLNLQPGIPRVLAQLLSDGVLCALATSAGRGRTRETLAKFKIEKSFSVVVTGEDARSPKPAPDIFLLAAAKLGVELQQCVVVEDSVAGVAAARAAGMKCVGFAPPDRFSELGQAGASDLISELPEDAPCYFKAVIVAIDPVTAAPHSGSPTLRG